MGDPGNLCEALTWWEQGRLCLALPGCGAAGQLCTRTPLPGVGSLYWPPGGPGPPLVGFFVEADAKS